MTAVTDAGYRQLASAVIIQAAREAHQGVEEAATWLLNEEESDPWLMLAELDRRAVLKWLRDGRKLYRFSRRNRKQALVTRG